MQRGEICISNLYFEDVKFAAESASKNIISAIYNCGEWKYHGNKPTWTIERDIILNLISFISFLFSTFS